MGGECVCPVEGCHRPWWTGEGQTDNKQLHNIAQAFAHMRDAILAATALHPSDQAWPNQADPVPDETADDSDSGRQTATRTQKTQQRHGRGRKGRARRDCATRAVERRYGEDCADTPCDEQASLARDNDGGVKWDEFEDEAEAAGDDELLGDREARARMRHRMKETKRQQQPRQQPATAQALTAAHSSTHTAVHAMAEERATVETDAGTAEVAREERECVEWPRPSTSSTSVALPASARCIVLSSASRSHSRIAQQAVERLGHATMAVSPANGGWSSDISHVVCCHASTDQLVKRTMKYMMAVLNGCWLVDWAWLTDSAAAGRWLLETEYEIHGDSIAGATHAPSRSREEQARRVVDWTHSIAPSDPSLLPTVAPSPRCSLLAGCRVCVLEPLSPQCPSLLDLTLLIRLAGGQLLLPTLNIANTNATTAAAGERAVADWVDTVQRQHSVAPPLPRLAVIVLCRPSLLEAVASGECLPLSVLSPLASLSAVQLLSIPWLLDSIGAFKRLPSDSCGPGDGGNDSVHSLTHLLRLHTAAR